MVASSRISPLGEKHALGTKLQSELSVLIGLINTAKLELISPSHLRFYLSKRVFLSQRLDSQSPMLGSPTRLQQLE